MNVFKPIGLAVCLSVLQACGGGGGKSATLPPAADTDKKNQIDYSTYNLNPATKDEQGQVYAKQYDSGSWQPDKPLNFWGQTLTGCTIIVTGASCNSRTGPSLVKPVQEVVDAWNQGWTGKGVNILMEDFLYDSTKFHGVITTLLAYRYAPGATFYGLNIGGDRSSYSVVNLANQTVPGGEIKVGVVNQSYTADMPTLIKRDQSLSQPWTQTELLQARTDYTGSSVTTVNRMKDAGVSVQLTNFNFSVAVITKAAGNDRILSEHEPLNWFLTKDSNINARLLIVGALNQAGTVNEPAEIASYSNKAGTDTEVSSRFLLASGTVPFVTGGLVVNGTTVQADSNVGTSYAAPRVAGMVAIVRSKFPNLNASQTASIMLDTARYDTLKCKTASGCDKTIYGRGEASLSRALAPVGSLR